MTMEIEGLPSRPFFSCTAEGLDILDQADMKGSARLDAIEPRIRFELGDRNIIDSRPRKAASSKPGQVTVECESGTVHIDFEDGRAKKVTAQGEFVYMGGLEDRNEGLGYIPVS